MKNVVIECQVFNQVGEKEIITFSTDDKMKEFLIYNKDHQFISARKIVLLQTYNVLTEEFEWI